MKKVAFIAVLVVLFSVLSVCFIGCAPEATPVDIVPLEVYTANDFYVGNKTFDNGALTTNNSVDLSRVFGTNATFELKNHTGKASLNGEMLTVTATTGEFDLVIKESGRDDVYKKVYIVDGINVFTFPEFYYATQQEAKVVVQKNLTFVEPRNIENALVEVEGIRNIVVKNSIYGNGHTFDAYEIAKCIENKKGKEGATVLECSKAQGIVLQDFKITGRVLDESETSLDLTTLERYGVLICFDGNRKFRPSGTIKNVIAENSHKVTFFNACDVTVEGCIIRNASDSTVSIETNNEGGTNMVFKNNVIANSLTAGIVLWGWTDAGNYNNPKNFADVTIEGFLDIYNWKNTENTRLMPNTEDGAGAINALVERNIGDKKYDSFFYKYKDKKWIQTGMIILATGKLKENKAVFHGLEDVNFEIREFPMPPGSEALCKTCKVVGYGTTKVDLKPDAQINLDTIYQELRNGR